MGYINTFNRNENTVTISRVGANAGFINFITRKFYLNDKCFSVLQNDSFKNKLDSKYMYYFLKYLEKDIIDLQSEGGVPTINTTKVSNIILPIPPLDIQNEIVRILDNFTELTAELTARKKQYTYYRDKLLTFEDGEVEFKALGEVGEFTRGSGLQKSDFTETGFPAIHYGQIYTYYGNFADKTKTFVSSELATKLKKARKNDLIIATTSENIEDVCKPLVWLGDNEVCVSGETYIFRHNQNAKYIAYYLQMPIFFDYKKLNRTGTKVTRVHGDKLAKFRIPIPSLKEQEKIVSILDKFDTLTNSISEGLPKEIKLRQQQYEYYRDLLLTFPKKAEI